MPKEYSGSGDPRRTMELLWGPPKQPSRGPKPGLSLAQIVQAAVELADSEGLHALSMRQVAERVGVGAMSLYTYVPGKGELLDLMLDQVFREVALSDVTPGDWRAALEQRAREDWALYERHPWVLQIAGARAVLGPNETSLFEATLRALAPTGLPGRALVSIVNLVVGYVRGAAQGANDAVSAAQETGVSNEAWWAEREPIFDSYFAADRFPTLARLAQEGAFAPLASGGDYLLQNAVADFSFGLERVLDGVEAFVRRSSTHRREVAPAK